MAGKQGDLSGFERATQPDGAAQAEGAERACTPVATICHLLYWSALVTTLVFPVITQADVGATLTILPAACGLASFSVTQLLVSRVSLHLHGKREAIALVCAALVSIPHFAAMAASAFSIQATLAMQAVTWTLFGIGQAFLLPAIGTIQAASDRMERSRKTTPALVACSFMGVAVFAALSAFATDPLRSFLPALYFACALILLFVGRHLAGIAARNDEQMDAFSSSDSSKVLSPLVIGSTFGLLICYCITRFGMAASLAICAVGCLTGGLAILLTVLTIRRSLVNAFIERCYFPITAACFFAMLNLPDEFKPIPASLATALFFGYSSFHWSLLIAIAHRFDIVSPRHFAIGLLAPAGGICIGWVVAAVFALAGGDLAHPDALFFGWAVAYLVVISIAPYAMDTSLEIDLLNPDEPTRTIPLDRSGNTWERACELLADSCRLSPREREVFGMLAHGRNVEYISTALFISSNTAKTHKYRIYRKLSVNTHQELLDRIEETERAMGGNL